MTSRNNITLRLAGKDPSCSEVKSLTVEASLKEKALCVLMTGTFQNTFYSDEKELVEHAAKVFAEASKKHPNFLFKGAVYARNEGFMRSAPILALVYLYKNGMKLDVEQLSAVCRIPTDLRTFLDFYKSVSGGTGGRNLRRLVESWLNKNLTSYWAIKYAKDIRWLAIYSHGKFDNNPEVSQCMKYVFKTANPEENTKLWAMANFANCNKNQKAELIEKYRLPFNQVSSFIGSEPELYKALLPSMPLKALLNNIKSFDNKFTSVNDKENFAKLLNEKFSNEVAFTKSKIFIHDILKVIENTPEMYKDSLLPAIENTFKFSSLNLKGDIAICVDTSGSMSIGYWSTRDLKGLALLFAAGLYKYNDNVKEIVLFDVLERKVSKRASRHDSVYTIAKSFDDSHNGGTDHSVALKALKDRKYSHIIYITDEQQNSGTPFAKAFAQYKKDMDSNTKAYIINLGPEKNKLNTNSNDTFAFSGFTNVTIKGISLADEGYGSLITQIDNMDIVFDKDEE